MPADQNGNKHRSSSYNIYIEDPSRPDDILLIHGLSGAADLVSRDLADYLVARADKKPPNPLYGHWERSSLYGSLEGDESVEPDPSTIEQLTRRGYLTTDAAEDEYARAARVVSTLHEARANALSFTIVPTYNCNLRCPYCFQNDLRTELMSTKNDAGVTSGNGLSLRLLNDEPVLKVMSFDMADRILAGIEKLQDDLDEAPPPEIGFFGGEPLLPETYDVVKHIMDESRARFGSTDFSAVTNATHLRHFDELLGPVNSGLISSIQITLDGPRRAHDTRRVGDNNSPTFDVIIDSIKFAADKDVTVAIRVNVDRDNIEELPELADDLIAEGLADAPKVRPYVAAIADSKAATRALNLFSTPQLIKALEAIHEAHPQSRMFKAKADSMRLDIERLFERQNTWIPNRFEFCGAHTGMYVVDAMGDAYACWENAGETERKIGSFAEDGTYHAEDADEYWRSRTVSSNPTCAKCRFAMFCGGGCAEIAFGRSGTIHHSYCDGFASRFTNSAIDALESVGG